MNARELIAALSKMDPSARVYAEIPTYQESDDSYYLRHFVEGLSEDESGITLGINDEPDPENPEPAR